MCMRLDIVRSAVFTLLSYSILFVTFHVGVIEWSCTELGWDQILTQRYSTVQYTKLQGDSDSICELYVRKRFACAGLIAQVRASCKFLFSVKLSVICQDLLLRRFLSAELKNCSETVTTSLACYTTGLF